MMREVVIIATGGTIDNRRKEKRDASLPGNEIETLLGRVQQEVNELCRLSIDRFVSKPGWAISSDDWASIAGRIHEHHSAGADAVIVTQGTDTLEETAYALTMMVQPGFPFAITGAMRRQGELGSEGGANIAAAVRFALAPGAEHFGCMVVDSDEALSPIWASKVESTRVKSFEATHRGKLMSSAEGRVHVYDPDARAHHLGIPSGPLPPVEILLAAGGVDGAAARSNRLNRRAMVVAGFGGGHVPPAVAAELKESLADGLPVVLATRCAAGATLTGSYAGPGSEVDLMRSGAVAAGVLSPVKARIRLMLALGLGLDPAEVFPV